MAVGLVKSNLVPCAACFERISEPCIENKGAACGHEADSSRSFGPSG